MNTFNLLILVSIVLYLLFGLPFTFYLCAKLGVYGFLMGKLAFRRNQEGENREETRS